NCIQIDQEVRYLEAISLQPGRASLFSQMLVRLKPTAHLSLVCPKTRILTEDNSRVVSRRMHTPKDAGAWQHGPLRARRGRSRFAHIASRLGKRRHGHWIITHLP